MADVGAAFSPLVRATPKLVSGAREWMAGQRPTTEFSTEVAADLDAFVSSRDRLRDVRPLPAAPAALSLFESSSSLYVETAQVYAVLVSLPEGVVDDGMRVQLDLLARRVRELGDRVYDRGQAMVDAAEASPSSSTTTRSDAEVHLPDEVPSWPAEGLAPGPPLDDPRPPGEVVGPPPTRAEHRPEQPRAAWVAAVAAAGIPPAADVARAIHSGDAVQLRDIARSLVAAAETLRAVPDPVNGREDSARARLALLVAADAARAAQAGRLLADLDRADADRLIAVARRVALVSDAVWLPGLPPRSSRF